MQIIHTHALGPVTVPEGYRWRIGIGPIWWPKRLARRETRDATIVHDLAYDGPWEREALRIGDEAFYELHRRGSGDPDYSLALWSALRDWAWITVTIRAPFYRWSY